MPVDRTKLPALGPEPAFAFPEIRRRTLANGVRVWTVEHRDVPLATFLVVMPVGAAADPPDRPGLAAIVGDLLDEGSGDLDALGVHEALGQIGAHLETEVGADATLLDVTVLARHAARALALLADMLVRPRMDPADFDRVRELRLNRLVQLRDLPPALADRAFARVLYHEHPYGHTAIGTEESLRAMTASGAVDFHRGAYAPARATVIAVGDASHQELGDLVEAAFSSWGPEPPHGNPGVSDPAASEPPPPRERLVLVHRPGAAQSELRIGHVAVPRSTPDYHAIVAMNMVLGGQFVSRINMNLREHKGYTYGARTGFDFRRGPGPFALQVSVQSDVTADAIRESFSELRAIRDERPVTRHELELGRAALTRGYPRNFETADHMARAAAQLALYSLPDDYFSTFVPRMLALTEEDATAAAARHIDPERLVTVIVGDRDRLGTSLESLGLGTPSELVVR
jgi:predicted Zn-dependent peptidase